MRKLGWLVFGVLLSPLSGRLVRADTAQLPPLPLTMKCTEAWNRHDHGDTGASGVHLKSSVRLQFLSLRRIRIEDKGTRTESELYGNFYNEKKTQWSYVWLGTSELKSDLMILSLQLSKSGCDIAVTDRNNAAGTSTESKEQCSSPPQVLHMKCRSARLKAGAEFVSPEARKKPQDAWICAPSGDQEMAVGTPMAWVFGKTVCLEVANGSHGLSRTYRLCAPAAASSGGAP